MLKKTVLFLGFILVIVLVYFRFFYNKNSDTVVVGVLADYPPFAFEKDGSDDLHGFDVDLIKLIVKKSGKTVEFRVGKLNELISSLKKQEIDIVISGIPLKLIKLSDSRNLFDFISYETLVVDNSDCLTYLKSENNNTSFSRIGVQESTLEEYKLATHREKLMLSGNAMRVLKGDSLKALTKALSRSEIDAIYLSGSRFVYLESVKNLPVVCHPVNIKYYSDTTTSINSAIVILKSNSQLKKKIQRSLADVRESGEYDSIKMRWVMGYVEDDFLL
ncbi:MAG: transporter substrate-binding domain-containing protein [Alphaproteobacteria bacterium]|nr:transporter substrate-binding domain-containing protein [Rickettsiales bacterium]